MMHGLQPSPKPPVGPMYRAMVGIGVLCGVAIVTVFELTRPVIARNQSAALERAVLEVLPDATASVTYRLTDSGFEPAETPGSDESVVYAGYDTSGHVVGIAIEAEGAGYQDRIRLLYGYSVAQAAVVGLRVMESRETPGVGDRIETDADFLDNFVRLDVSLAPDRSGVAHPIEYVAQGEKTQAWQVDGISGATISSTAVARILRESTSLWIPRIREDLTDFNRGG